MTNIWGFFIQTLAVSVVAGIILLVKWMMRDKLSPRWQYGVWSVLAVCIFWPVSMTQSIISSFAVNIEVWKANVEMGLESVYSQVYEPIGLKHVFPLINEAPMSITDWLFVIYTAGSVLWILRYVLSYCRIRLLFRKGVEPTKELQGQIDEICDVYQLKKCKVVVINGLPSAFVCGVFSPVLAVPDDTQLDDKIILHELLHLKYKDSLQSIVWCILRSLHWCNPFMQWVFNHIGNDMEALCDQRVLELLEGEERRDYGMILLNMANEKYARVPGTTSISNGGKNISRRIEAIVRFKKYPKGMALVSVCIVIVLGSTIMFGNYKSYAADSFSPESEAGFYEALAIARLNRCTTVVGALDTYAKGLRLENGIYIATASSLKKHEEIAEKMMNTGSFGKEVQMVANYHYESGTEFGYSSYAEYANTDAGYWLYNLVENADGSYHAVLGFGVEEYEEASYENELEAANGISAEENELSDEVYDEEYDEEYETGDQYVQRSVLVPVKVTYEDAWVVEETGERMIVDMAADQIEFYGENIPYTYKEVKTCDTGVVTFSSITIYGVDEPRQEEGENDLELFFLGGTGFNPSANLNAKLEGGRIIKKVEYCCLNNTLNKEPEYSVTIRMDTSHGSYESCEEVCSRRDEDFDGLEDKDWNGTVEALDVEGYSSDEEGDILKAERTNIMILWDGEVVEEITMEGDGE